MLYAPQENNQRPSFITLNQPLAPLTWFKTGGPAQFFAQPQTADQFAQAIAYAAENKLPIFVLGEGANILIADEGFAGLVIRPQLNQITHENNLLTAGAGASLNTVIEYCLNHNIIGLEEFSGIPGTVGGSVYINLHYFEFLISQFLVSAKVIDMAGTITTVDTSWFNFGYDQSQLHEKNYYLLEATFNLKNATDLEIAFARGRRQEIIRHRARRYPQSNTCGSFFRNFHPHEVSLEVNGIKMIYVAYYLDKLGIKGNLSVGGASVSYQHANMIVNNGNATSADIIGVARSMQEKVRDAYGITPQPECQLIGFSGYPFY